MSAPLVQACLNGDRARDEHPAIPVTAVELAADAERAVAAGADELHVHVRGPQERDTLDPALTAAVVEAVRESCPGTPLGLTTGLWAAGGDPGRRLDQVAAWDALPDYVSVNVSEDGFEELCGLLAERGVGIEAGVWSVSDAAALGAAGQVVLLRVLVEVGDGHPVGEVARAAEIETALGVASVQAPQLHHGEGLATWAVIDAATRRGHAVRVGLEDTLVLPDRGVPAGNADLVAEAVRRVA